MSIQISYGQSSPITEIISKIEFQEDTIRSVFNWVTDNIKYDVKKAKTIENGSIAKKLPSFKSEEEYRNYQLEKVIQRKKGVCEDYSLLFKSILQELGYESYVVPGYNKVNGKVNRKIGHAWNAVKVNEEWKLFDPTWGAGYVDGSRFVKNFNEQWYDVDAKEMITSHMPFDPIWQLLDSPISYKAFNEGKEADTTKGSYPFNDLIAAQKNKGINVQMKEQVARSEEMGEGIRLVVDWRKYLTKQAKQYGVTSNIDLLNNANENGKKAVALFNDYMKAKSKKFKGSKWSIEKAEQKLLESKNEAEKVLEVFSGVEVEDTKMKNSINKSVRFSTKLLKSIDKEIEFIEKFKSMN